jgi:hypothetical protein
MLSDDGIASAEATPTNVWLLALEDPDINGP